MKLRKMRGQSHSACSLIAWFNMGEKEYLLHRVKNNVKLRETCRRWSIKVHFLLPSFPASSPSRGRSKPTPATHTPHLRNKTLKWATTASLASRTQTWPVVTSSWLLFWNTIYFGQLIIWMKEIKKTWICEFLSVQIYTYTLRHLIHFILSISPERNSYLLL